MVNKIPSDDNRPGTWQLIYPFWISSEKWLAILLLAVILTINFTTTYAFVALNRLHGKLTDALVALNWPVISNVMIESLIIGALTTVLPLISVLAINYLTLRWRTWMTARFVERWTEHPAYYQLERDNVISNSDQRVAEDINLLPTSQSIYRPTLLMCWSTWSLSPLCCGDYQARYPLARQHDIIYSRLHGDCRLFVFCCPSRAGALAG